MKQIVTATIQHLRISFSPVTYALCFLIITVACWLNYYTAYTLWPDLNKGVSDFFFLWLLFTVFFFLGYVFTRIGYAKKISLNYWWVILAAPLLFSLKVTLPYGLWVEKCCSPLTAYAIHQPVTWAGGLIFMVVLLLLLHRITENKIGLFFTGKTTTYKVYLLLLLLMLPLLLLAETQPSFQNVYPKAKILARVLGAEVTVLDYVFFELSYMLDFITIELFFRGMLIALLSRAMGVHCIIPVALFYFSIHLGKPMFEAISSFFGGLILGAVSYETKSIWGGWMVHCGIALFMELFGFLLRS